MASLTLLLATVLLSCIVISQGFSFKKFGSHSSEEDYGSDLYYEDVTNFNIETPSSWTKRKMGEWKDWFNCKFNGICKRPRPPRTTRRPSIVTTTTSTTTTTTPPPTTTTTTPPTTTTTPAPTTTTTTTPPPTTTTTPPPTTTTTPPPTTTTSAPMTTESITITETTPVPGKGPAARCRRKGLKLKEPQEFPCLIVCVGDSSAIKEVVFRRQVGYRCNLGGETSGRKRKNIGRCTEDGLCVPREEV